MQRPSEERRLQADVNRLRSRLAELEHAARKAKRVRPEPKKEPVKAAPFQLVDPRRNPKAGEKVLPPLTPPLMLGRQMGAAVGKLLREMAIETRKLVRALGQQTSAMDAPRDLDRPPRSLGRSLPDEAQLKIEALKERYRQKFEALAEEWSRRMILGVEQQSTAQLSLGLKGMAERMEIHATMAEPRVRAVVEAATQSSAFLIKRIPEQYLGDVQVQVMTALTTGTGLDQLVPYLTEKYEGDARHAHLVALDQVRKATESFNAARLQAMGVEEYVWIHVGGERYPRKLHQSYSGQTFRYDAPPIIDERTGERGHPGVAINCRCRARPILKFTNTARP